MVLKWASLMYACMVYFCHTAAVWHHMLLVRSPPIISNVQEAPPFPLRGHAAPHNSSSVLYWCCFFPPVFVVKTLEHCWSFPRPNSPSFAQSCYVLHCRDPHTALRYYSSRVVHCVAPLGCCSYVEPYHVHVCDKNYHGRDVFTRRTYCCTAV